MDRLARGEHPFDMDDAGVAEPRPDAELLGQQAADHLLLHLPVQRDGEFAAIGVHPQVDQRIGLRQFGQRPVQRTALIGVDRLDDRLQARCRELPGHPSGQRSTDPVPNRQRVDAVQGGHLTCPDPVGRNESLRRRPAQTGDPPRALTTSADLLTDGELAGEYPCPSRPASPVVVDFEHQRGGGGRGWPRPRQQRRQRVQQVPDAGAGQRRADQQRHHRTAADQPPGQLRQPATGETMPLHHLGQQVVVVPGEHLEHGVRGQRHGCGCGVRTALGPGAGQHHHLAGAPREPPAHLVDDPAAVGAGPVNFVDEEQRRHLQPAQRPPEHHGLRLDALDRRDHQDGGVQHGKAALHLGDEVGMAGGVDQVDLGLSTDEGRDIGADGDAAAAFQLHRVGPGGAEIDPAETVDGAGLEQQPFGQAGLAGVNVGENPQVEKVHAGAPGMVGRSGQGQPVQP